VGDVVVSGHSLFGMTQLGGVNDSGTIYRLSDTGGSAQILHSFSAGSTPSGSLISGGATLYGMTSVTGGFGDIFSIAADGSAFTTVYHFQGGPSGGADPLGSLLLSGSKLYGMTQHGGAHGAGAIFSLNADGTGFSLLYSFGGADGANPQGGLVLSGSTLYGMTTSGGTTNGGVVFQIDVSGSGYEVLHTFAGDTGTSPQGSLIIDGSTLYGTTASGGALGAGTVFALDSGSKEYAVLHNFGGGADDGSLPTGSLTQVGSQLYGTTQIGGVADAGTIFEIGVDGTGFGLLHSFAGGAVDGASPQGSLTFGNGQFYGTTAGGGSEANNGTVFAVAVPEPGVAGLLLVATTVFVASRRRRVVFAD